MFLSGNEAVAFAARDCGVALGTGYPGTPSTEILERFAALGGRAQWSPNEKVALEVAIGVAYAGAGALVTMKHVGLNVAADPLFTVAYTGVSGPLVIVSADDPGMASSQNEQDSRRYAVAAGVPMLEPADSQEAYDFTRLAIKLSRLWKLPFLLRMTTRVCHSSGVIYSGAPFTPPEAHFEHDIPGRVMIPAYARPAHRRLREKLYVLRSWNETHGPSRIVEGSRALARLSHSADFFLLTRTIFGLLATMAFRKRPERG
jgi:indolepyruvate ferredoxin oxidoreductase alpha subunit